MAPRVRSVLADLLRRKEQILNQLHLLHPQLVDELRAADLSLDTIRLHGGREYAFTRSPSEAILKHLERKGEWTARTELAHEIIAGGFIVDPVDGPRLLKASMATMVRRNLLITDEAKRLGLPSWPLKGVKAPHK